MAPVKTDAPNLYKTYIRLAVVHSDSTHIYMPHTCFAVVKTDSPSLYMPPTRFAVAKTDSPNLLENLNTLHSPPSDSATGGLANEASIFYRRLASLLASKWDHPYSSTLCSLRCSLAFTLLHSAIQSIRGARSSCGHAIRIPQRSPSLTPN